MDFQPSAEQLSLQEGIRAFCDARLPLERLPDFEGPGGVDRSFWLELAQLGIFQLRVSEAQAGLGLGAAELVLVFEALGRQLVPGPLVWSELAAGRIGGAATGEKIVGGLDLLSAAPEPYLVEHAEALDTLLLLRPEGVFEVAASEIESVPLQSPLDPLTPMQHARRLPQGTQIGDAVTAQRLRIEGMTAVSAQLLGIAEATLELALAYAKQREQFGRSIGSFQAIKHMLADMFVRQELARAAVYAAGATLDHPEVGDVDQAARGAKIVAGESAMKNARACIQIHGGMGYTWEIPAHYYLKRCWVLESTFGAAEEHAEHVAEAVSPELTAAGSA
jgi:alkylation response protein AidB-like acyl-CoA dehydrogenase